MKLKYRRPMENADQSCWQILFRSVSAVVSLAINAFLLLLFVETIVRSDFLLAQAWMVMNPKLAWGSWGLLFLISLTLLFALGSMTRSMLLSNIIFLLMGGVYHFKLLLRGEPFCFADIMLMREATGIVGNFLEQITIPVHMYIGAILLVVVVPCIFIGQKIRLRAIPRLASCVLLLGLSAVYGIAFQKMDSGRFTVQLKDDYQFSGFLLGFAHTMPSLDEKNGRLSRPANYGSELIGSILEGNEANDKPLQNLPDVLFIMSEALYDLERTGKFSVSPDPLAYLRELQDAHWGGTFISQTYGGGTVLSEYEVLTGYRSGDMWGTPYRNRFTVTEGMESLISIFEGHGYATHAIHQGVTEFYDRGYAYRAMGFDAMTFSDDMSPIDDSLTGYPSDAHLYEELIRVYESRDNGKPWFCHAVTYQNHGPYGEIEGADAVSVSSSVSAEGKRTAQNYSAAVLRSMEELRKLLTYFENQEKPIMIVLWGDHAPNLSYFGLDIPSDPTQAAVFYETPLLIWSNYGLDVEETIPDIPDIMAGYRVGAYALRLLGIESDAYFNYLSSSEAPDLYEVFRGLSAVNGERVMDEANYLQAEEEMAALHYDRLMGENYGRECDR